MAVFLSGVYTAPLAWAGLIAIILVSA